MQNTPFLPQRVFENIERLISGLTETSQWPGVDPRPLLDACAALRAAVKKEDINAVSIALDQLDLAVNTVDGDRVRAALHRERN